MSIGIFTPFRGTMLKIITHRLVFVVANRSFTKKTTQCGCISTRLRTFPQVNCAVHVLTKLEVNRIRPNVHTYDIVHAVFGNDSIPLNKLRRIVYWFDKFDEMYPDPSPKELPENQQEFFEMAVNQITDDCMTISAVVCKVGPICFI